MVKIQRIFLTKTVLNLKHLRRILVLNQLNSIRGPGGEGLVKQRQKGDDCEGVADTLGRSWTEPREGGPGGTAQLPRKAPG